MARVIVGLSGGVDSAVSAALLRRAGHRVTGIFIKIWQPEFIECTWREDRLDAMRVCAVLGIPFKEIDLSEEYRRDVVERMVATYERGATPNPDVLCNQSIKFGAFFEWARKAGAEYVATGHYAQSVSGHLLRGLDSSKDQSYFLHRIAEDHLRHTMFPIGGMKKDEVRALAARFNLPVAAKPDSQGLCFVGDISLPEFLGRYVQLEPGIVRDEMGTDIGTHEGAALFTIGQRHGFHRKHASSSDAPCFVIATDVAKNEITVSPDRSRAQTCVTNIADVHWINTEPDLSQAYSVQSRYREEPVLARIERSGHGMTVLLEKPRMLSPGQSIVVYEGNRCLGGGVIESNEPLANSH